MSDFSSDALRRSPPVPAMFFVIVLVQLVSTAGLTTIYSMITHLRREYAGGAIDMGWAITVYLFVAAAAGVVCGRLGDVYNRKIVVLFMLSIAAFGAFISIVVPTPLGVLFGCALQGLAGALTPVDVGLAKDNMPARHVPLALGAISAAGSGGAGLIFYSAGWITDHFASHGAFVMKLIFAVAGIIAVAVLVPSRPAPPALADAGKQIRFVRSITFVIPLAALLVGINRVLAWGLFDPRTLGLFAIALFGSTLWFRDQARQVSPLVDTGLLRNRRLALTVAAHFILGIGVVQYGQIYSFFLQEPAWTGAGLGLTAAVAGLTLGVLNGSSAISAIFAGKVVALRGARWTAILGTAIIIAGYIALFIHHSSYIAAAVLGLIIVNGIAFATTGHYALFVEESPEGRAGETSAMGYIAFTVAMALGSQIILALFDTSTVADPAIAGLRHADGAAFGRVLLYTIVAGITMIAMQWLTARRSSNDVVRARLASEIS